MDVVFVGIVIGVGVVADFNEGIWSIIVVFTVR